MDKKNVNDWCREFRRTCTIIFRNVKRTKCIESRFRSTNPLALGSYFWIACTTRCIVYCTFWNEKEIRTLVSYEWTDEALDARVKEGTEIAFCADCIKRVWRKARNINIIPPTLTFENQMELDLGEVTCVLKHVGGDHAHDSVVMYIKEEKILF